MAKHWKLHLAVLLGGAAVAALYFVIPWGADSTSTPNPAAGVAGPAGSTRDIRLSVRAVGFDNDVGRAIAVLFRPGAEVTDIDAAYSRVTSVIRNGEAQLRFPPMAEGAYALIVVHDENENGSVDHGWTGLPAEQLGFSNGFRPGVLTGLPSFEKLQFPLERPPDKGPVKLRIEVKHVS